MIEKPRRFGTVTGNWKQELDAIIKKRDWGSLRALAKERPPRVIRYLQSRLYEPEPERREPVLGALGELARDTVILDHERVLNLLRRFVWALNDESGAVPFGVPEAIGEILAARPEFQETFLPLLCGLLTEEEMSQTGPIERGALWAAGRVGPAVAACSEGAVRSVRATALSHPDPATCETARRALEAITGEVLR